MITRLRQLRNSSPISYRPCPPPGPPLPPVHTRLPVCPWPLQASHATPGNSKRSANLAPRLLRQRSPAPADMSGQASGSGGDKKRPLDEGNGRKKGGIRW